MERLLKFVGRPSFLSRAFCSALSGELCGPAVLRGLGALCEVAALCEFAALRDEDDRDTLHEVGALCEFAALREVGAICVSFSIVRALWRCKLQSRRVGCDDAAAMCTGVSFVLHLPL